MIYDINYINKDNKQFRFLDIYLKLLLEKGLNPNETTRSNKTTALNLAAINAHKNVLKVVFFKTKFFFEVLAKVYFYCKFAQYVRYLDTLFCSL